MEPTAAPRERTPDEGDRRTATTPSVSLPKGGGALRSIGEMFGVAAATGTAVLQIPVPAPQGRSGFGPSLTLSYDSGAGNGRHRRAKYAHPGRKLRPGNGSSPWPTTPTHASRYAMVQQPTSCWYSAIVPTCLPGPPEPCRAKREDRLSAVYTPPVSTHPG
ncbi:SpvB/TcaC N-terminal domain-containing protein [Streptomyces sp. NPDC058739]|uniref:SpvB/TcaC N-terminal domain-containing protein n=1 Tax=Streptomyces sp. NPDC058739 TaxID=3346618 RepID=UPI0036887F62